MIVAVEVVVVIIDNVVELANLEVELLVVVVVGVVMVVVVVVVGMIPKNMYKYIKLDYSRLETYIEKAQKIMKFPDFRFLVSL